MSLIIKNLTRGGWQNYSSPTVAVVKLISEMDVCNAGSQNSGKTEAFDEISNYDEFNF